MPDIVHNNQVISDDNDKANAYNQYLCDAYASDAARNVLSDAAVDAVADALDDIAPAVRDWQSSNKQYWDDGALPCPIPDVNNFPYHLPNQFHLIIHNVHQLYYLPYLILKFMMQYVICHPLLLQDQIKFISNLFIILLVL